MCNTCHGESNSCSGSVLLEVLISILVFSLGVLGLVGMHAVAIQNSVNSQDRAVASILASDMVSQMWVKKSSTTASPAISGDIAAWKLKVEDSILSNAVGDVTDVAGVATITVTWKAPHKAASENSSKYETSVYVR